MKLILNRPTITQAEMSSLLNITPRMIRYYLSKLVNNGYIRRVGSNKKGKWMFICEKSEIDD